MTDATETNSFTALTVPKFTATQIETDCPAQLQDLAKELTEGFEKLYQQKTLVSDQEIAVKKLIAEIEALCDVGGFAAFQKMFFPNLGKSRVYELLAIGTNKKSAAEIRASNRARVAKHRANKAAASGPVTVTEKSVPVPGAEGAPKVDGEIEAPSIASEQMPEPAKPRSAIAPGDEALRAFTVQIMELHRRTAKRPAERFASTAVPIDVLVRLGKLITDVADLKKSAAAEATPAVVPRGAGSEEEPARDIQAERPVQDAEELRP